MSALLDLRHRLHRPKEAMDIIATDAQEIAVDRGNVMPTNLGPTESVFVDQFNANLAQRAWG